MQRITGNAFFIKQRLRPALRKFSEQTSPQNIIQPGK